MLLVIDTFHKNIKHKFRVLTAFPHAYNRSQACANIDPTSVVSICVIFCVTCGGKFESINVKCVLVILICFKIVKLAKYLLRGTDT
jgi:hypothetical protein